MADDQVAVARRRAARARGERSRPAPAARRARPVGRRPARRARRHDQPRGGAAKQAAHRRSTGRPARRPARRPRSRPRGPRRRRGRPFRSREPGDSPCPGNGGMRPVNNSRSVPVLMPLQCLDDDVVVAPARRAGAEPASSAPAPPTRPPGNSACQTFRYDDFLECQSKGHIRFVKSKFTLGAPLTMLRRSGRASSAVAPAVNPASPQQLRDLARRPRAAAAHGEQIEAEIGVAHRLRAGRVRHRLGDEQSAAGRQRVADRGKQAPAPICRRGRAAPAPARRRPRRGERIAQQSPPIASTRAAEPEPAEVARAPARRRGADRTASARASARAPRPRRERRPRRRRHRAAADAGRSG